ncbi:hypothetical protein ElyMa_004816500 [Elysia marginata]|uniref:Uncharacterized protein n=1 Tax=Elysia marginata TaxID=1093978 RepID=A0AAV4IKX1_9GAST|nr:hypothetical protein ElyMa_004816500 [Elysia marginata]
MMLASDAPRYTSEDFGLDSHGTWRNSSTVGFSPGKPARQRTTDNDGQRPSEIFGGGRDADNDAGGAAVQQNHDDLDDDDTACGLQTENIPAVEDLVPRAKRLFPDRSVSRLSSTGVFAGSDGRGKSSKLKTPKPRSLFVESAAANNKSRAQLHEDILDLTRVIADGKEAYVRVRSNLEAGNILGRGIRSIHSVGPAPYTSSTGEKDGPLERPYAR